MAETSLRLEDQLCFSLYAASRAVTAFYRPLLDELGLTYPQYLVLLALWESDRLLVGDLGEALALEYGTLSPLLKRLEAKGLVRRERQEKDERAVLVALTDAGRELRKKARSLPLAVGEAMGLDGAGQASLRGELRALTDSVTGAAKAGRP